MYSYCDTAQDTVILIMDSDPDIASQKLWTNLDTIQTCLRNVE
jgi:hypothetical protein